MSTHIDWDKFLEEIQNEITLKYKEFLEKIIPTEDIEKYK